MTLGWRCLPVALLLTVGAACSRHGPPAPAAGIAPAPARPADSAAAGRERVSADSLWAIEDSLQALEMVRRGRAKSDAGRDSAAALDYREALRLRPRLAEAYEGLAIGSARAGRAADVLALVDSAAALGDSSAMLTSLRGRALVTLRRCPEAVAVLAPFVRAHPEWTNPTPDLARCYLALHRAAEAVPLMQQAVRREPDAGPLRYALVDAFTANGQPDSALVHARYLTDHHPDDGYWWAILARTLFMGNRIEEARAAYERGFRLRPGLLDELPPIDRSAWETLQRLRPRSPPP